ncbi:hypothetical protein GCM10008940_00810 [Microbulbifer agarilyticus]
MTKNTEGIEVHWPRYRDNGIPRGEQHGGTLPYDYIVTVMCTMGSLY